MRIIYCFILSFLFHYINLTLPFINIILEQNSLIKTTYIYGHLNPDTDAILSPIILTDFLTKLGNPNIIVPCRLGEINKETQYVLNYFKKDPPLLISDLSGADEVILVDHNSPSQSLDFKNAKIVGLIDHHAITGFEVNEPIEIITKPVGCTCTILYQLYKYNNITISKDIAGLMMSAIISDTLLLKSSITTQEDIDAVVLLSDYIDLNYQEFGIKLLSAGTNISDLNEYEIINLDNKKYTVNGYKINIAFLNSIDPKEVLVRKKQLLKEINKCLEESNEQLFILVIVNIIDMDSYAIVSGKFSKIIETVFGVEIQDNETFLKGINSRKKDVYPKIANALNALNKYNYSKYFKLGSIFFLSLLLFI